MKKHAKGGLFPGLKEKARRAVAALQDWLDRQNMIPGINFPGTVSHFQPGRQRTKPATMGNHKRKSQQSLNTKDRRTLSRRLAHYTYRIGNVKHFSPGRIGTAQKPFDLESWRESYYRGY